MKKIRYSVLLILFLSVLSITGCKKDDEVAPPTKTDLLTAKPWKIDKVLALNQPITDPNTLSLLGAFANASMKFNKDGTYTATNSTTNATTTGTWEFNTTQTQLILDKGTPDEYTFNIDSLTEQNLNVNTQYTVSGFPIRIDVYAIPA